VNGSAAKFSLPALAILLRILALLKDGEVFKPSDLNAPNQRRKCMRYRESETGTRQCPADQSFLNLDCLLGVLLILVLPLAGCGKKVSLPVPPPPTVSVILPVEREVVEWDEYTGRIESPEAVEVRARVNGYLNQVHFKEGKEVKKGDLLFTIDRRPYQAEFDRVEAERQRAESQADLAKSDADRARNLIVTKAISQEDFDTKTKTYSSALAAVKAAHAAVDSASLNLEFTEIRSPIDGRIGRALVTEGNLVSGGVAGAGATMLTTIVSQDPLYCYVDVDERSILKYLRLRREGRRVSALDAQIPVEVALADEKDFPRKGHVDFVDNRVDPTTGTVRCRGVIANPERTLGPGFFARLRIPGSGRYPALLLPDRAFGSDQAQKFVYVINAERKVEFRPVIIGPIIDGLRVVTGGLKPGEQVVVEGLVRVRPGIVVDAKPWEAPKQASPAK
jgi:RND family efflux transporter MFP subunit